MATKKTKRAAVYMLRVLEGAREDRGLGGYWAFEGAYGTWAETNAADATMFPSRKAAIEGRARMRKDHALRTEIVRFEATS